MRNCVSFVPSTSRENKHKENPIIKIKNKNVIVSDAIPCQNNENLHKRQKFIPAILRRGNK